MPLPTNSRHCLKTDKLIANDTFGHLLASIYFPCSGW